jgi:hypothetical protein
MPIDPTAVYAHSDQMAAKAIDDEFIIVPVTRGSPRPAAPVFLLNETGREVWERLNGRTKLGQVVDDLVNHYNTATPEEIRQDVWQLVKELSDRDILIKLNGSRSDAQKEVMEQT